MRAIHLVVAVEPKLLRELLISQLKQEPDLRVAAVVEGEMAIATALRTLLDDGDLIIDDPVVVITSADDQDSIPASCARLLFEFPEITVLCVRTPTNRIQLFQLRIDVEEVRSSLDSLYQAIRKSSLHSLLEGH